MLRDYQTQAIDSLRMSLAAGKKRPVLMAPTGAGKTVIAAAIIRMAREKGKRVMFVVPMLSLIDQTVERFAQNGITEVGVIQGFHELTDWRQPIQVCSLQTLARRKLPDADLVIVDEAHVMFKFMREWAADPLWGKVPFIGLTATPWQKGMGKVWDDLIIVTTTAKLIELGHLSDFRTFAPAHPDLKGVKTVAGDFDLKQLGEAMDRGALVADIVSTWMERGQDRPTVCFAVNRAHAGHICDRFNENGVRAEYMDAFTDREERNEIVKRFERGETKVICNVGVLTTGFDSDVRCIILARPTKSRILYAQMIGRGLRTAPGKDFCLILDHSDTTIRLGFVTDLTTNGLDDGKPKKASAAREKEEPLPKECPKCACLRPAKVRICPSCGFEAKPTGDIEEVTGELHELTRSKTIRAKDWPAERKEQFYRELICYANSRGYKPGWAYHAYRSRFGVGPANSFSKSPSVLVSPETAAWIKHYNIAKAKAREAGNARRSG